MSTVETGAADALVVGAGPTGLALAIELARQGVSCRIIDKAPGPSQTSKALGVQARTLEYFERIGVADAAVAAGRKAHGINVFSDGEKIIHLSFDAIPSRFNYVLILPQSETERLLTERLVGLGVVVERNVELVGFSQGDGVEAVLRHGDQGNEERVRVRWLLGCDGAHSVVRRLLGVPFAGLAFEETFSLADARVESDLPADELSIYLHRGDILAFFPMKKEQYFRMVIQRRDEPPAAPEPTVEEFQKAIDDYGPKGARAGDPIWMSRFHISQRQAADYRRGDVFLLGDAAHIHSPIGGQGMNTGIQDACNLAWKLALVASGRGRAELLDSYQAERHPVPRGIAFALGGADNDPPTALPRGAMNVTILTHLEHEADKKHDVVVNQVAKALKRGKHKVSVLGVHGDIGKLRTGLTRRKPDLVFNLMETFGDNQLGAVGVVGLLDLIGVPYTGGGPGEFYIQEDKGLAKKLLAFDGVRYPEFAVFSQDAELETGGHLRLPLFVKPLRMDASIGIDAKSLVHSTGDMIERVRHIHKTVHDSALVEEYVEGREFYVGVLGNVEAKPFPPMEMDFSGMPEGMAHVLDSKAKWDEKSTEYKGTKSVVAEVSDEVRARLQETALNAYRALRVRDYGRIDMRLTAAGEVYVIEVNASCYLEETGEFASSAAVAGIDYPTLINRIADLACERQKVRRKVKA